MAQPLRRIFNPPFGTPWKKDLAAWGIKDKKEITDLRFVTQYDGGDYSMVPDIGDPQMLFLANNVSKMKTDTALGSRIVEVHNGSSLFNGKAGSGASNLRRYIIEQDLLEAIVALPENMFYNTGIGTFLWIVTNRKSPERRGKIQLIDATKLKKPLRKNIGQKNCEITRSCREQILALYQAFDKADPKVSKVFPNEEFGYWSVEVARPLCLRVTADEAHLAALHDEALANLARAVVAKTGNVVDKDPSGFMMDLENIAKARGVKVTKKMEKALRDALMEIDETAAPVIGKEFKENVQPTDIVYGRYGDPKGGSFEFEANNDLKEMEQIPLTYAGGLEDYWVKEILPYAAPSWLVKKSIKIGYEFSFTKYFYEPVQLRSLADIDNDILATKQEMAGLLDEIVEEGGRKGEMTAIEESVTKGVKRGVPMKESGIDWLGEIPAHWELTTIKQHFHIQKDIAGKEGYDVLSITQTGIKKKNIASNEGQMANNYSGYQFVHPGEFAMNHMDLLTGYIGLSPYFGVTSPDYRVFVLDDVENCDAEYFLYVFQLGYKRRIFYKFGHGAASKGRWRLPAQEFLSYVIPLPPIEEQREIVRFIESQQSKIDQAIAGIQREMDLLCERRTRLISDAVTGQIGVRE